jgi:hypothetical protein
MNKEGNDMRILLAALLATVIVAPCMAKDGGSDEDRTPADVQTPGKTEPLVPDTLKSAPAQRIQREEIQSEGRARATGPAVEEKERGLNNKKSDDIK